MARKTRAKRKKATRKKVKRKQSKRKANKRKRSSRNVAKKKRSSRRITRSSITNVFKPTGIAGKAALGIGAATLVGVAVDRFAPQFSGIAKPVSAFLAGGPVGVVAQVLLTQGSNLLGLGSQQEESGGL